MKERFRISIFGVLFFLFGTSTVLFGQQDTTATGKGADSVSVERVRIDKADRMRGMQVDTSEYMFLIGSVELSQDTIFMYCDSALVIDLREVRAYGNVIIQKGDSLEIFADSLIYHSDSMRAQLDGDVVLKFKDDQMWTSKLDYDLESDLAYYYTGAVMVNDSVQISSRKGYYYTRTAQARFIDSVVVIGEEVTLIADSLDYNTDLNLADFIGPTLIYQDSATIYCEDGFYDVAGRSAEFRRNARYSDNTKRANADTIAYDGALDLVHLRGNAHFEEDDQVIDSDEILYFQRTGRTLVLGNAVLSDSLRYVESDRIEYFRETDFVSTDGRSKIIEGPQILSADRIDYDQATGLGKAWGNVVYNDTSANVVLVSDTAYLDKTSEYVKAFGSYRPLLKSLVDEDTLFLTADTLVFQRRLDTFVTISYDTLWTDSRDTFLLDTLVEYSSDSVKQFEGFDDVRLFKGTLQGLCDSLSFQTSDSLFRMIGDPILWSDTTQFTADTITIQLRNEAIDKVNLIDKGLIVSEVRGQFYNQIKGRIMVARMVKSELDDLDVNGNAESVYYAIDEDGAFIGVNKVVASTIYFTFDEKQLSGIRLYSQPDGKLIPMEDVDHSAMRLDGFTWQQGKRPKTLDDLF